MKARQEYPLLWCLEGVDLVAGLNANQKEELLKLLKTVDYRRGETLFLPGDSSDTVYFLHEGLIKIFRFNKTGKRLTLQLICRRGQPFGIMALAGQEEHDLIAQAMLPSRLCIIAKDDLLRFVEAHPKLYLKIAELLGSQKKKIEHKLADVVFLNVPARLAKLLLELAREFGKEYKAGKRIEMRFTHQELAELIGASREQVTKILNRFRKEKLLMRSQGRFTIRNENRLYQMIHENY